MLSVQAKDLLRCFLTALSVALSGFLKVPGSLKGSAGADMNRIKSSELMMSLISAFFSSGISSECRQKYSKSSSFHRQARQILASMVAAIKPIFERMFDKEPGSGLRLQICL